MVLEASLWFAGVRGFLLSCLGIIMIAGTCLSCDWIFHTALQVIPHLRQGRVPSPFILTKIAAIAAFCLLIAYFSRYHQRRYQPWRFYVILLWRMAAVNWPTFMMVMEEQHVRIVDSYPTLAYVFGSSFFCNLMTTSVAPLQLKFSILLNITISIFHLYSQFYLCHKVIPTNLDPIATLNQLHSVLSAVVPIKSFTEFSLAMMPTPFTCFLLFIIVEVLLISACYLISLWVERSSRIHFLMNLSPEELNDCSGHEELYDLTHGKPVLLVVGTIIIDLCLILGIYFAVTMIFVTPANAKK